MTGSTPPPGFQTPGPNNLEARDVAVLAELARDTDAHVAFQGLRRRLALHQEVLSRALRRLQRSGLVERDSQGYHLTPQGLDALEGRRPQPAAHIRPVVEAALPAHVGRTVVVNHLSNRWFQGLRWYGLSDGPEETGLTWLTEPERATVRVRVRRDRLVLEVEEAPGAPDKAFTSARGVLAAVAELYGIAADANGPAAGNVFVAPFAG